MEPCRTALPQVRRKSSLWKESRRQTLSSPLRANRQTRRCSSPHRRVHASRDDTRRPHSHGSQVLAKILLALVFSNSLQLRSHLHYALLLLRTLPSRQFLLRIAPRVRASGSTLESP